MAAAIDALAGGGVSTSSSPTITRVGTAMDDRSGVESGRVIIDRRAAAHRQATDDCLVHRERLEQIRHVARVILQRGGHWHVARRAVETAELRHHDAPPLVGERVLRFPHARSQRERVKEHESAGRLAVAPRHGDRARMRFQIPQT